MFYHKAFPQSPAFSRCGFGAYFEQEKNRFPEFEDSLATHLHRYIRYSQNPPLFYAQRSGCQPVVIPVVVHVIYNDTTTNISETQIRSQIQVLNEDYRKIFNTPGHGTGKDAGIQFCLASRDPNGNPTTGITRTQSVFTNHTLNNDVILRSIISWNDTMYLNIWVVKNIFDNAGKEVLGYASFPGSPNPVADGVVIRGKNFGTTGSVIAPYDGGRTTTHEVGHYLGLFHTFETDGICDGANPVNCLSEGDKICDTPAELEAVFGCPADPINSCTDFPCDQNDRVSNYMNFADDLCMDHFTAGQVSRMFFFLSSSRTNLYSPGNLTLTGCDTMQAIRTKPTADFSVNTTTVCAGQSIVFTDLSDGCVETFLWSFPGGSPSVSGSSQPTVLYSQPGIYPVTFTASNAGGSSTITRSGFIQVSESGVIPPKSEGFEGGIFVPAGWKREDEDGAGSWLRTTFASSEGGASAVMPNFTTSSCGTAENLISYVIDLSTATSANLRFDYAYKARSADTSRADIFRVWLSDNCGQSFDHLLFDRKGQQLATVSGFEKDNVYIPSGSGEWQTAVISLGNFLGNEAVRIRFQCISRKGQHLFLDNIQINATVGIEENLTLCRQLSVYPNPFSDKISVKFSLKTPAPVTVSLFDINGRLVAQKETPIPLLGEIRWEFSPSDTQHLCKGIYLLRLTTPEATATIRVVKM
ncbi:MAG: M43 family zinc metalloprotease [Bacteroidia bacterium]|nr:M43 family zinc metalloprotease [Bacteroidia bacterium]